MAFREVELSEEEKKGGGRKFKKFSAIGDAVLALFVRTEEDTVNYSDGPKRVTKYIFWNRTDGEFEVTPDTDLAKKLKKAQRPESEGGFGMAEGLGHLVKAKFASTLDTGQASPMKVYSLAVDTSPDPKFLTGTPSTVLFAKQSSRPDARPAPDDDIPF